MQYLFVYSIHGAAKQVPVSKDRKVKLNATSSEIIKSLSEN